MRYNPNLNWLIVSDNPDCPYTADNLRFIHISIQQLELLISQKLEFSVQIYDPIKLCDFKPVYGKIFSEYTMGYDYWGYCDFDLIIGNLQKYLDPVLTSGTEVISFYRSFMSGPLCLFKNSEKSINLFKMIQGYKEFLMDSRHMAMDENNISKTTETVKHSSLKTRLEYFLTIFHKKYLKSMQISEIRYQYQWFLKRKVSSLHPPFDMTDLIFREEKKGGLTTRFHDLIFSDRAFKRWGLKNWNLTWNNGKLFECVSQREIPVFHFVELKNNLKEKKDIKKTVKESFALNNKGFYNI